MMYFLNIIFNVDNIISAYKCFSQEPQASLRPDKQLFRNKDVRQTEQRVLDGAQLARVRRSRGILSGRDRVRLFLQLFPDRQPRHSRCGARGRRR